MPFRKTILLAFILCSFHASAQSLTAFGGVGVSYDGFLADKAIMKDNKKWPFTLSPQAVIGMKFEPAAQTFDALLEASVGMTRIELNIPGSDGRIGVEQFQSMVTVGSGLHLQVDETNVVMPYVLLGASYFANWGTYSENSNQNFRGDIEDNNGHHWDPVVGAGVDWQFRLITKGSFNLRFVYTPLDVFQEPITYRYGSPGGYTDGSIQGKVLQCIFTFRVYVPVRKWKRKDY